MQIWVEDNKSGYIFWNHINKVLFNNRFRVIKGKGNRDVRNRIISNNSNELIIVIVDRMLDNHNTEETYKQIVEASKSHSNIGIASYGSTERAFLTYKNIYSYIRETQGLHYMKYIRSIVIKNSDICGSVFFNEIADKHFLKFCRDNVKPDKNGNMCSEALYSALLASITNNTMASITKDKIGPCWILDCCNVSNRTCSMDDDKNGNTKILDLIVNSEFGLTISDLIHFINLYTSVRYHGEKYDIKWKNVVFKELRQNTKVIDIMYFADKYMVERGIDSWNYEKIYRRFMR